ncbi:MAG: major facilitator superfamily protein [Bacillus sp. (in: firmicutes)]|nr:major facilitator superfamily protein [Bacillus sp. (in: firmicutes)]
MNKPRLWTKDFLIDSLANFFIYLTYYLLMLIITVYAIDHFQASPSGAGLASGIFIIGAMVGRLFAGRSSERVGLKKMLYFGLFLFFCTTLLYFIANSLSFLFVVRFLNGAGFGVASTATGTIISSIIPDERRGEGTGYYALSTTLASAIGPFLGIFLTRYGNFSLIFVMCTIVLIGCCLASFFLKVPKIEGGKEQLAKMKGFKLNDVFELKALPISIISALMGFSFSAILSFLTSYTREINLVYEGSFFFIVYAFFIIVSRPFTGVWFDKKGKSFVMYPAFLSFAIGLMILSQAHQGFFFLLSAAFIGLGFGTFMSSAQAISVQVSPRHRIGLATSTFFVFLDGGIGIGPFLLGYFIPVTGFRGVYVIAAMVVIACILLYFLLYGRKKGQKQQQSFLTFE